MKNEYMYFTFGSKGHPYSGGWVKIKANDLMDAQDKFHKHFGVRAWKACDPWRGILAYASHYDQEDFDTLKMFKDGNLGAFCHEVIE